MVADIMNVPVICPRIGEAAALGGAIQALWCDSRASGPGVSLQSLCDRYVALDDSSALNPAPAAVAAYETAYDLYRERLGSIHPGA
jgi:xylulokinase